MIIYRSYKFKEYLFNTSIGLKSTNENSFFTEIHGSNNIAIDWIHNLIYFNVEFNIYVMNINNKRMRRIIAYNEMYEDIVVNPIESFIIWSIKS